MMNRHDVVGCVVGLLAVAGTAGAGRAQQAPLRLDGEVRVRHEMLKAGPDASFDPLTLLRTRLGLTATLAEGALARVRFQDARVFGEESSTLADGSADQLDLHEGYLELSHPVAGLDAALRAGRQEIVVGNERLVGAVGWSNTGRSFDGVHVALARPGSALDVRLFAATVMERGSAFAGGEGASDHTFGGVVAAHGAAYAWLLHDRAATVRAFTGVDRTTLGGHLPLPLSGALSGWVEGAWQGGNQVSGGVLDQSLRAWFGAGRLAWAADGGPLRGLAVGADLLSGDAEPGDDTYRAFSTLYATNHKWYGTMDRFLDPAAVTGERGLVDLLASVQVGVGEHTLDATLHHFRTAAERASDPDRHLGWELDLTLPVKLGPTHGLLLGYGAFLNGEAAPLAGLGAADDVHHAAYIQASVAFPSPGAGSVGGR